MLSRFKCASLLAMMFLAATPAFAQGPGGPGGRGGFGGGFGGRGGSVYGLLGNPAVQEELALSDEQKSKTAALNDAMRDALRPQQQQFDRESFQNLSQEERRERFDAMRKEGEERRAKVQAEYQPKFAEVLDELQLQRLHQINWQLQGNRALLDADLAKAIGLSQEQKEKISALYNENRGGFAGGRRGQGGNNAERPDREAARAEFQARTEKLNNDVTAVLTDAQKAELANQLGEKFDTSKLRGPRGGEGGSRGEGGRNRRGPGGDRPQRRGNNT